MAISFSCPSCSQQFNVGPQLAGKRAKCTNCGVAMVVPAPQPQPAVVHQPSRPGDEFFRDALPASPANRRVPSPLDNHVVTDPGFAAIEVAPVEVATPSEFQFAPNPALADYRRKEARAAANLEAAPPRNPKSAWKSPAVIALLSFLPFVVLSISLGFIWPLVGLILCCVLIGAGSLTSMSAEIWGIVICYQKTPNELILYLLVPFYRLYYLIQHWRFAKDPFLLTLVASVVQMLAVGGLVLFMSQMDTV